MPEKENDENPAAVADPAEVARTAREALRRAARGLAAYHLNACVRCGLCGETCHIYRAEPEPENLPGVKAAKVASSTAATTPYWEG